MKLKVGDRVKLKSTILKKHSGYKPNLQGQILTITGFCTCGPRYGCCGGFEEVEFEGMRFAAYLRDLIPIDKKIPITEVDFLDCFQINFKDGV